MGIKNLKKILGMDQNNPKDQLSSLAEKKLAVDAAIWLTQFVKSSRHIYQMFLLGYEQDFDKELEIWLLDKLKPFWKMNIQIIFVTEGGENPLKFATKQQREKEYEKHHNTLALLLDSGNSNNFNDVNKQMKLIARVTARVWYSLKNFCSKFNMLLSGVLEADPRLYISSL